METMSASTGGFTTPSDSASAIETASNAPFLCARSAIAVPLYREGRVVGALNVVSPQAYAFDDTDLQTLQLMAGFIASALRHAVDFEAMRSLIAEHTAALAALQEGEEHTGAILDATPDAIVIDTTGRTVDDVVDQVLGLL